MVALLDRPTVAPAPAVRWHDLDYEDPEAARIAGLFAKHGVRPERHGLIGDGTACALGIDLIDRAGVMFPSGNARQADLLGIAMSRFVGIAGGFDVSPRIARGMKGLMPRDLIDREFMGGYIIGRRVARRCGL